LSIGATALDVILDRRIAYAVTDCELRVVELRGTLGIFEGGASSWIGRSLLDLVPELVGSEAALEEIFAGHSPRFQLSWVNRDRPDGGVNYYTLVNLPRYDEHGGVAGLVHVIQDVTEMGALEQQIMQQRNALRLMERALREQNAHLAAANAELRRLDQAKTAFVSVAAHELRTPLASISGYIEMLLDGDAGALNDRQAEFLKVVDGSAQRLLRITRDLLDAARLESGRMELILRPTDFAGLVDEVLTELRPQLEAREQSVTYDAAPELPLALVDRGRAAQVLANLIVNASKFGPARSPIRIELRDEPGDAGWLRVSITDEGPGVPPEEEERLFRPFERGAAATTRAQPGVGLGLYISRSIVELHGGRLWLQSPARHGASFFATFPAVSAQLDSVP
jgi:signal transduction histidine kinase